MSTSYSNNSLRQSRKESLPWWNHWLLWTNKYWKWSHALETISTVEWHRDVTLWAVDFILLSSSCNQLWKQLGLIFTFSCFHYFILNFILHRSFLTLFPSPNQNFLISFFIHFYIVFNNKTILSLMFIIKSSLSI